MPLKKGASRKVISDNIRELMHGYQRHGRLGRSRPPNPGKAARQAAAIAYDQARRTASPGEQPPPEPRG